MRQRTLLVLVGGIVFVGVGVATLPASLVTSHLPPEITLEGVSGSIWSGAADTVRLRGAPLGAASWTAAPLSILGAHLEYHLELASSEGFVRGRVSAALGGTLTGDEIELDLPIAALGGAPAGSGWTGELSGIIHSIRLEHGWPVSLVGALAAKRLRPPGAEVTIGSYALEFDPQTVAGQLTGRVRDTDSPLIVRAQLVIKPDRSFSLEGDVTPRPGAPSAVTQALAFLGAPDAIGRRQFVLGGSL